MAFWKVQQRVSTSSQCCAVRQLLNLCAMEYITYIAMEKDVK